MPDRQAEHPSWVRSNWAKWSWFLVLGWVVAQSLSYQWRVLPTSAAGYFSRGKNDFQNGDFESAVFNLTRSIELEPEDADAYVWRGATRVKLHDLDRAMSDLERALELQPGHEMAYAGYGDAKAAAWDNAGAIDAYSRALASYPDYPRCLLARGKVLYDSERWDDAATDLRKGARLLRHEHQVTAQLLLWVVRARAGDSDAATAELASVVKAGRVGGDRFRTSARFLCGELAEPAYLAEMAALTDGDRNDLTAEAFFLAGSMRLAFGNRAGALERMRKVVETGAAASYAYDRARVELERLLLGFHPMWIDEPRRKRLSLAPDAGLVIASVVPGGPADAARIRPGEVVATIGGVAANQKTFVDFLSRAAPGSEVMLELIDEAGARVKVPLPLRLDSSAPTR